MSAPATLPPRLAELAEEFEDVTPTERLQLLLELSTELPELPPHLARDSMQRVPECQSPLYLAVEVGDDQRVHLYFDAPPEAPPPAGSRRSCTPGWTANRCPPCSAHRTTSTCSSVWPRRSARCGCAAWPRC